MITYPELLQQRKGTNKVPSVLIALDPGETTGVAVFKEGVLSLVDQIAQREFDLAIKEMASLISTTEPTIAIIEDYKVYSHKADAHKWSKLHTPRLIGGIQALCILHEVPYRMQMASAKSFCNDERLKDWRMYQVGKPHATDAVRHGLYFILFGGKGNDQF